MCSPYPEFRLVRVRTNGVYCIKSSNEYIYSQFLIAEYSVRSLIYYFTCDLI